ncbi:MAG TPA: O-methyltransferase [Anaerolineae bacterium]|nr:O-methyltransferase [Anaerolineae bacterium]
MRHSAYQLRPNKAVDRLFLIEAIRRLDRLARLREYTYYGLGGPYLEDFRLLYELYPEIKMVSIEEDADTVKRQEFHLPCAVETLTLEKAKFKSYLAHYEPNDKKSIFWLDYTGLSYGNFEDLMVLLGKVSEKSMVKITLRAQPSDFIDQQNESLGSRAERFRRQFGALMPDSAADPPRDFWDFACLLQDMVQVAAQKALPGAVPLMFQPVSSFYYSDGTGIFTLTGVVCRRDAAAETKKAFEDLHFCNLTWAKPKHIDVPVLSTKERLHLQNLLPCSSSAGRTLREALGYLIDKDRESTEAKLKQYADFHRYYPYFMRAVP